MANWKRLHNPTDVLGINILLRESYNVGQNVSYYAGIVAVSGYDGYTMQTSCGKVEIRPDEYTYHFITIDEIRF